MPIELDLNFMDDPEWQAENQRRMREAMDRLFKDVPTKTFTLKGHFCDGESTCRFCFPERMN
jgi:hypothetical protein